MASSLNSVRAFFRVKADSFTSLPSIDTENPPSRPSLRPAPRSGAGACVLIGTASLRSLLGGRHGSAIGAVDARDRIRNYSNLHLNSSSSGYRNLEART